MVTMVKGAASGMSPIVRETDFPNVIRRGKVRDIYPFKQWLLAEVVDPDELLLVATDRLSAFDVVFPGGIPDKGRVLTLLSKFWFELTGDIVPNHFIRVTDDAWLAEEGPAVAESAGIPLDELRMVKDRGMIVKKAERVDIECVARGYLSGSGWQEYRDTGKVCGIRLPPGLRESEELPQPIFTPATKAASGHDLNISFEETVELVGAKAADVLRVRTLAVYNFARDYARERGIIIADTKLEFGWLDDELIVIDELCTPDSSRFWPADGYRPGRSQPSFDKQPVRDWLIASGWNKEPPPPDLPVEVVESTAERYREAFRRLTGQELPAPS